MTWTHETKFRHGVEYPDEHVIYENGTARLHALSLADAAYITALLNLTTQEQRDGALFSVTGAPLGQAAE